MQTARSIFATVALFSFTSNGTTKFKQKKEEERIWREFVALKRKLMRSDAEKRNEWEKLIWNYRLCGSGWHCQTLENNKMPSKRLYVLENSVLAACSIGDRCCKRSVSTIYFFSQGDDGEKINGINYNWFACAWQLNSMTTLHWNRSLIYFRFFFLCSHSSITIDGKLSRWFHESCEQYGKFGRLQCGGLETDAISTIATTKTTRTVYPAPGEWHFSAFVSQIVKWSSSTQRLQSQNWVLLVFASQETF